MGAPLCLDDAADGRRNGAPSSAAQLRPIVRSEQGFILVVVLWLLVLLGSVAALLMLRAHTQSMGSVDEAQLLRRSLAFDSALEIVAADRLFHGPQSVWWQVPVERAVTIGGRTLDVRLSSESTRVDLNNAGLAHVDDLLRSAGASSGARAMFVQALAERRAAHRRLDVLADADALAARSGIAGEGWRDRVTLVSGLTQPRVGGAEGGTTGGDALRLEARDPSGALRTTIFRQSAGDARALLIYDAF